MNYKDHCKPLQEELDRLLIGGGGAHIHNDAQTRIAPATPSDKAENIPPMPIFKTVDSAQGVRIVYAFWCCGILYERDTYEEAEKARATRLRLARMKER